MSARTLTLLLTDAERRGVDGQQALQLAGLTRAQLDEPSARVPDSALRALALHLLERVPDPAWGLELTASMPAGTFGSMGFAFRHSDTLADSIARLQRFSRLINEAARTRLTRRGDVWSFAIEVDDQAPLPRAALRLRAQMWLSGLLRVSRRITAVDFAPVRVSFPFARPEDLSPYDALFRCELVFDAPQTQIELSSDVMALPVVDPDRDLGRVMERYAERLLERLPDNNDLGLRVRQATCRAVELGEPRISQVARELGMSARSLQRKLQAEDISFSQVLDEVRRELALSYLEERELSVDQVAAVLGFASGSSFAKAFRRWTGCAPGAYR